MWGYNENILRAGAGLPVTEAMSAYENSYEEEWYHGIKPFRLFGDEKAFILF